MKKKIKNYKKNKKIIANKIFFYQKYANNYLSDK